MSKPAPSSHFCFLLPDGSEKVFTAAQAREHFGVDGFLRADPGEHARCAGSDQVCYFNLGQTTHVEGFVYGVTPVLRPGRRASENQPEMLPLLGGQAVERLRAVTVHWYPEFPAELDPELLRDSLLTDKSMPGLRAALVKRYAPAAGSASEGSLLVKGLSATLLERVR